MINVLLVSLQGSILFSLIVEEWWKIILFLVLTMFYVLVIEESLVIKVVGEPVLKLNTGILKCQIPSSMKHQVQIVSWKFGNNFIYSTKTWPKGNWSGNNLFFILLLGDLTSKYKNCFNFPRSLTHPPVQDNNGFYQFQKRKILWFQARFRSDERILSNNYRMKTSWLKQTYWLIKGVCFSVLVYLKIATYKQSYWIYQKMTEFYFVKNCHLT